ncbi:predicted protein [Nematostella vectensis]|uniref:Uncharacterized protein n=1 Tax=Nematostella vectensis TaxID=45351 RepID=A7SIP7_NEMVE|nr:predicted protein [Nematostella vectensis]|eukprot:XP_001628489.1 predicted protein [Nematostella vectensis]
MDFAKALDNDKHDILVEKLKACPLNPHIINCISDVLPESVEGNRIEAIKTQMAALEATMNSEWERLIAETEESVQVLAWIVSGPVVGCMVYRCDFHRVQACERWTSKLSNSAPGGEKHETLTMLPSIAESFIEDIYLERFNLLKESTIWKRNEAMRRWFENIWLKAHRYIETNTRSTCKASQSSYASKALETETHPKPTNPATHPKPTKPTNPATHPKPTNPGTNPKPTNPGTHPKPMNPGTHPKPTNPATDPKPTNPGTRPKPTIQEHVQSPQSRNTSKARLSMDF